MVSAAVSREAFSSKAAVFGAVDYISLDQKANGENIDVIFPVSGTVVAPRPAMILKWSKHVDEELCRKLGDGMKKAA